MAVVRRRILFAIHGKPEDRCEGPIAQFKGGTSYYQNKPAKSQWVCLSQSFVDCVAAKYPLEPYRFASVFGEVTQGFGRWERVAKYPSLQAETEAAFEAKAAEAHAKDVEVAERREKAAYDRLHGVDREGGSVAIIGRLSCEVNKILEQGQRGADAFQRAWNEVKSRISARPAEWIEEKTLALAKLISTSSYCDDAADIAREAFPEVFQEAA